MYIYFKYPDCSPTPIMKHNHTSETATKYLQYRVGLEGLFKAMFKLQYRNTS